MARFLETTRWVRARPRPTVGTRRDRRGATGDRLSDSRSCAAVMRRRGTVVDRVLLAAVVAAEVACLALIAVVIFG